MANDEQKKLMIVVLILILGIGAILLMNLGKKCPSIDCPDCQPCICPTEEKKEDKRGIEFIYLYPPGCEGCNSSQVAELFRKLNLGVRSYQNDGVPFPHVLVMKDDTVKGNISTMVSDLNRYNVLQFLCLTRHENACYLAKGYLSQMQSCLSEMNISLDRVAFHYSDSCEACNKSYWRVDELEDEGYNFLWLNEDSTNMDVEAQMQCLAEFMSIPEGVPQYICVSTGEIHTDTSKERYKKSDIEKFAKRCREGNEG